MVRRPALGIVEESPERAPGLCAGKARTWNGKPGPLANGNAHIYQSTENILNDQLLRSMSL